ncbi:MAG: site-specific integrase [Hydrogenophaga sp.]|uniref:site-specific integrase n=1 Tax=Hydrogenophaga sp. TaxID=1904254 RepID=UPI00271D5F17|nr:site-specific integrase [Hydrogenophaga sp.]MDO9571611.1 site-specific integrase [Hydrogenophaga sp.]
MEQSEVKLWPLLHRPQGPLAPHIDAFAVCLSEQGFKRHSISQQIRLIAKLSRWMKTQAVGMDLLADEHFDRFRRLTGSRNSAHAGDRLCLSRLMTFLRQTGVVRQQAATPAVDVTPIQIVIAAYRQHLRQAQALSPATLRQYIPFAEQFLAERFASGAVELSELRAADVVGFITRQAARLGQARAKCSTIALRSFLRYLRLRGDVTLDLAAAVPTVPNWSMTGVARAISAEDLRAVLQSCQRDTAAGCRDYAILLLLARLGLRAGEIVALTLESIDWELGSLTVIGSKGGKNTQLPLPADVGEATSSYLLRARPRSRDRTLFLRTNAPIRGLGSPTSIGSIVGAAIARTGLQIRHGGAHQFRHALACEMLRQGASLTEIGSLLRHQHVKTTSIYAKVDFAALRPLALPWPGVQS